MPSLTPCVALIIPSPLAHRLISCQFHRALRPAIASRPPDQTPSGIATIEKGRDFKTLGLLLLLLGGFAGLLSLLPLRTAILMGADEGFALSKAVLYLKGYHFYTEVWNDQPLLHTVLIAQVLKHVCSSILGPRLLTSMFALSLLASIFIISRRINGLWVAALTVLWLMASPGFLELSGSCMVEIPALAPPVAALALLLVGSKKRYAMEILAGVLFGVGLHIKFNAAIYLPLAGLILWLRPANFTKSVLVLLASVVVSFMAVHTLIGEGSYLLQIKQSWESHVAPARSLEYGSADEHPFPWSLLLKNWDTTVPATIGIIFCCRRMRQMPLLLIPVAWLAITLLVFVPHKPWWSYYYLHNSIPLCWCAAIGLCSLKPYLKNRIYLVLLVIYLLGSLAWMGARVYLQIVNARNSPQIYSSPVLKEIEPLKPFTTFMFTDQPVYSFHTGIPLPPQLAVLSLKRLWSGQMTNERLVAELEAVKPGIILLAATARQSDYSLLQGEYRLIYEDDAVRLYALKSVIQQANQ
jgi:hypothetical protein